MSLCLKVEASCGATIQDTCKEVCMLARKLDIIIECNFNDVNLIANSVTNPHGLENSYLFELEKGNSPKIAIGI